jgi:hypothetical protein
MRDGIYTISYLNILGIHIRPAAIHNTMETNKTCVHYMYNESFDWYELISGALMRANPILTTATSKSIKDLL